MKTIKRGIICFILSAIMILSVFPAFADTMSPEANIKNTITRYFDFQHTILSKLDAQGEVIHRIEKVSPFVSNNYLEKFECVLEMKTLLRKAQPSDTTYDYYSFDIRYDSIDIADKTASVKIFIVEKIIFNQDRTITSEAGTTHFIKLINENGHWLINSDKYELDGVGERYDQLKSRLCGDKQCVRDSILTEYAKDVEKSVIERTKTVEENPYAANIKQSTRTVLSSHTYNPGSTSSPVTYAHTYCRTNNPSPWYTYTADCTNFTSIAIHQIIPMDTTGNKWYFNSTSDKTASWTSAQYFRQYIYYNNSSTTTNSGIYGKHDTYSNCSYGDIVQYASDPDNIWSTDGRPKTTHGSIVTKVSGGYLYVSMHSYGDATSDYRYDYLVDDMDYTAKIYLNIVRYYD